MIVYLDMVFLTNMLLDFILLWITGKILQKKNSRLRTLFAAILGGLSTVIILLLPVHEENNLTNINVLLFVARFLTGIIMVKLAYDVRRFRDLLVSIVLLYGLSFLLEGFLNWISGWMQMSPISSMTGLSFVGMLIFAVMFLSRFYTVVRERFFSKQYSVPVLILVGGKQADGRGLVDSGNSLIEPITQKPVVVIEQDFFTMHGMEPLNSGCFAIPYHALGTDHGILKGFLADEIHVLADDGERTIHKVMVGIYEGKLSMHGDYQILLHPDLLC